MISCAAASLKWMEDHEEKIQEQVSREKAEKKEAEDMAKAIKESLDMQEQIRQNTKLLIERDGWDAKWGCPKCDWKAAGSTCCNPNKIAARLQAEKLYSEKLGGCTERWRVRQGGVPQRVQADSRQDRRRAHERWRNLLDTARSFAQPCPKGRP